MSDFEFTNRLINEKSPYLLQHAHNPVDWFPWGKEAFEKAKKEDKPVFLSIGYSTCHWCHVMERESFEDAQVAEVLNRDFVAIKVDREERPDLDHIYMSFCQAFTGQGGWPLSVFITSERKPFFAGTYFPKNSRVGIPGFLDVLRAVTDAWGYEREILLDQCQVILDHISRPFPVNPDLLLGLEDLDRAYEHFRKSFDPTYGGFSEAPKFPGPHVIGFLLRYGIVNNQPAALEMVTKTLDGMYRGGIYDHIGGGFSRYSTDAQWLVPHFEKMLYDNALLAIAYTEAFQLLKNTEYRRVVENVLGYILRDMVSPDGGFFSAEDADSGGIEGKFYIWDTDEVKQILGDAEGARFCELYDITEQGNFEGMNIPNLLHAPSDRNYSEGESLDQSKARLLQKRNERERPLKDDKILASWNGLMIAAMSKAYQVFGNREYLEAAQKALRFVTGSLRRADGRLLARYRQGEAAYLAYADDYAYLVWGILELYAATFNVEYLHLAQEINGEMLRLFWDDQDGGLFFSGSDAESEILKPKEIYDGAVPSANSVAVSNLLRLSRLTDNRSLADQAEMIIAAFTGKVKQFPAGYSALLSGSIWLLYPPREIVITGSRQDPVVQEMLNVGQKYFLPNTVIVLLDPDEDSLWMQINPSLASRFNNDGQAAAFVCQNYACQAPVYSQEALEGLLSISQNQGWSGKM